MSSEADYLDLDFTKIGEAGYRYIDLTKAPAAQAVPPSLAAAPIPIDARSSSEHAVRMGKVLSKTGIFLTFPRKTQGQGCAIQGDVGLVAVRSAKIGDLVSRLLASSGFAVRRATNASGIAKALKTPPMPRLLMLDVTLPDVSGLRVLAAIRRSPQTASIPVIMLASDINAADLAKAITLGADAYLARPISLPALSMALHAIAPSP